MSAQARFERPSELVKPAAVSEPRGPVNGALLTAAILAAVAAALIAVYVIAHPFIPQDAAFERAVQSIDWGPLGLTFPVFAFIGDAKGGVLEGLIFVVVVIFNRRAWLLAAGASLTVLWYLLISHLVLRLRPTTGHVLRVTEHLPGSSFPSGHTIFIVTIVTVLMLGLGRRFLPGWGQVIGWILAVLIVAANGVSRMYEGVHWPTDVVAAILIAVAWLCLWTSIRRVSGRALERASARGPVAPHVDQAAADRDVAPPARA